MPGPPLASNRVRNRPPPPITRLSPCMRPPPPPPVLVVCDICTFGVIHESSPCDEISCSPGCRCTSSTGIVLPLTSACIPALLRSQGRPRCRPGRNPTPSLARLPWHRPLLG